MSTDPAHPLRILIIRRDNIGDLVCTTPLIRSLRQQFPLCADRRAGQQLQPAVVADNPDLDHVYAYTKGKHRDHSQSGAGIYLQRLAMYWALFRCRYDYIVLADTVFSGRALSMARWFRLPTSLASPRPASHPRAGFADPQRAGWPRRRTAGRLADPARHQPRRRWYLQANPAALAAARSTWALVPAGRPLIGLHISACKLPALAGGTVHRAGGCDCTRNMAPPVAVLVPGAEDNPFTSPATTRRRTPLSKARPACRCSPCHPRAGATDCRPEPWPSG